MAQPIDPDIEARARELTRVERPKLPRGLWTASAIVSLVCLAGFAVAWFSDRDVPPQPIPGHPTHTEHHGLYPFLLVLAAVITVVSVFVARRRHD
ncbi:MAG: hypothetical protein QM831_09800 [Kofleriaceae bacterium]